MGRVRIVLLVLGVVLLGVLLARIGVGTVLDQVASLSWRLLLLPLPYGLVVLLDTFGWRYAFRGRLLPFSALLPVRLAGEAFNMTSPTASLGGEPIKVYLLYPRVSVEEGIASVIIDKTMQVLALGSLLLLGIVLSLRLLPTGSPLVRGMEGLALLGMMAVGGFIMAQRRGLAGRSVTLLNWLGFPWHRGEEVAQRLDKAIATFYTAHRPRLALSYSFHLMGFLTGSLEVYLILWLLGLPTPLLTAIVIEAFSSAIRAAGFLIPSAIGVQEGGNVAIFLALGLTAGVGLSFSLLRRMRELVVVIVGLTALTIVQKGRQSPSSSS